MAACCGENGFTKESQIINFNIFGTELDNKILKPNSNPCAYLKGNYKKNIFKA